MPKETVTTLEKRVERIEKHLSKKHWLDEDSGYTLDPNALWPWPLKIIGGLVLACLVGPFLVLLLTKVPHG